MRCTMAAIAPLRQHKSVPFQIISLITGADGFSHPCSPTRPLAHERFPALGGLPHTGPHELWRTEGVGHNGMHNGWQHPAFLVHGVPISTVLSQKVVTADARLSGWGGIYEGRTVRDLSGPT